VWQWWRYRDFDAGKAVLGVFCTCCGVLAPEFGDGSCGRWVGRIASCTVGSNVSVAVVNVTSGWQLVSEAATTPRREVIRGD
jgi:hypothetical protein